MATLTATRERKTAFLTKDEWKLLKAKRKQFHTETEFSEELNMSLTTLRRILEVGSGSPANINTIKSSIL